MLRFSLAFALLLAMPATAQTPPQPLSEAVLRDVFPFAEGVSLKLASCEDKRHVTCTHIWGQPDPDDETRIKLGGSPDGFKVLTVYAQARAASDFDRVLSSYKDAEPLANIGLQAVWSSMRQQLSLITADNLIIHIAVDRSGSDDPRAAAIRLAEALLAAP